jgi:hypothetical protein
MAKKYKITILNLLCQLKKISNISTSAPNLIFLSAQVMRLLGANTCLYSHIHTVLNVKLCCGVSIQEKYNSSY